MQTFTNTYTGTVYNYIKEETRTRVADVATVDFGLRDAKGRAVGMLRWIDHVAIELDDSGVEHKYGRLLEVGKPTNFFAAQAISARNGEVFGSARVYVTGATLEEVTAEIDARIERARKAAQKKFAK